MLYILFSTDVFVVNLLIDNVKILLHVMIENEALFVIAVPKTKSIFSTSFCISFGNFILPRLDNTVV